eukprot:12625586-Alexandrium_andersonii.AAC.1
MDGRPWSTATPTPSGAASSSASASGGAARFTLPPTPAQINYLKMLGDRLGRVLPDNVYECRAAASAC